MNDVQQSQRLAPKRESFRKHKLLGAIVLFLSLNASHAAIACSVQKNGANWDKDELIEQSKVIVIAELVHVIPNEYSPSNKTYVLKATEVLKGSPTQVETLGPRVSFSGQTLMAEAQRQRECREARRAKPFACGGIIYFAAVLPGYSDNTFSNHTEDEFWQQNIGRSPWPCCICGPEHSFIKGEKYLLFPDAFGAMKSGEIVTSPNDKWLAYVRDKLR